MFNIENWWTGEDDTEKKQIDVGKRKRQTQELPDTRAIFSVSEKKGGKAWFTMAKYNRQWLEMLNI